MIYALPNDLDVLYCGEHEIANVHNPQLLTAALHCFIIRELCILFGPRQYDNNRGITL